VTHASNDKEQLLPMVEVIDQQSGQRPDEVAHSDDVDQSFRSDADQFGAKRRRALSV
jgi:hypothetical protein